MVFVFLSWLIFRLSASGDLSTAFKVLCRWQDMFNVSALRGSQIKLIVPFLVLFFLYEVLASRHTKQAFVEKIMTMPVFWLSISCFVYGMMFAFLLPGEKTPFIYFQF